MPSYFRWEGIKERSGCFCEGVIEFPTGDEGSPEHMETRLRARGIRYVCSYGISYEQARALWEHEQEAAERSNREDAVALAAKQASNEREALERTAKRKAAARIASGIIGLAGCSTAAILLPMPTAIWAASAFAALTAAAAVPP